MAFSKTVQTILWAAGLLALIATLVYGHFRSTPYFAVWAWLSFMGMLVVEDAGTAVNHPGWRPLPRVTLVAAIIVFRKHPEVVVLVALAGAAAASVLRHQSWPDQATTASSWVLLGVGGCATFGLIGFADPPRFVAATVAVILVFSFFDCWGRFQVRSVAQSLSLGTAGALLALAWRTPGWFDPIVLRLGQLCLLVAIGLLIGALLGSQPPIAVFHSTQLRRVPRLLGLGFVLLLVSAFAPTRESWILAAVGLVALLTWALIRRAFGPVVFLLGGLCNEIARGANGGRMPVDVSHLSPAMRAEFTVVAQHSAGYVLATAQSGLLFLADRFAAGPYPGVASLGDLIMAAGIVWWQAGTPGIPRRASQVPIGPALAA